MKRMVFIRVAGTNGLVPVVREETKEEKLKDTNRDGCSIKIKNGVLNEAKEKGIIDKYAVGGKCNVTQFYKFGDITLITINCSNTTVFDSDIQGEWIGDKIIRNGLQYHYSSGKNEQKHTLRIQLPDVLRENRKHEKVRGSHAVPLNKYLWDVKLGKAGNPSDLYIYDENESHHEKASWDNRIKNTMNLTKKEHKEHHKIISGASHQLLVNINTLEELEAFLDYVRNN